MDELSLIKTLTVDEQDYFELHVLLDYAEGSGALSPVKYPDDHEASWKAEVTFTNAHLLVTCQHTEGPHKRDADPGPQFHSGMISKSDLEKQIPEDKSPYPLDHEDAEEDGYVYVEHRHRPPPHHQDGFVVEAQYLSEARYEIIVVGAHHRLPMTERVLDEEEPVSYREMHRRL